MSGRTQMRMIIDVLRSILQYDMEFVESVLVIVSQQEDVVEDDNAPFVI